MKPRCSRDGPGAAGGRCHRTPAGPRSGLVLLGLLSALGGCQDEATPVRDPAPVPVRVHLVTAAMAPARAADIRAAGTVRLRRETPLAFVADGRLVRLDVREGDLVRAGQLLAALDQPTFAGDAAAAEAAARQAEAELARQRRLFLEGWVAKAGVDQAEAAAGAARAQREAALFRQANACIVAPGAGVVLARLAEPGQTVAAGMPVIVVGEFAHGFVLRVPLAAGEIARHRLGLPVEVGFGREGPAPMTGHIVEIAGRADPATGSFLVEVLLPQEPALRSGLVGTARFRLAGMRDADAAPSGAAAPGAVRVPASAVFTVRADEGFALRLEDAGGRTVVRARLLRLGAVSAEGVMVEAGLAPGDWIVATGVDRLVEGMPVLPAMPAARGGAGADGTGRRGGQAG